MLDQLMQLIQQSGQQSVVENNEVPNENNDAILNEAQQSITSGLQDMASTGELNTLMDSVQNGQPATDHPAVQNISNNFMGSIMEKFGLNKGTAATIAAAIIPMVLSKMMNKGGAQQGSGGFDLGGLLSSLTGGGNAAPAQGQQGGGIMDTISSIGAKFGMDKDGDGDVDLNDLGKMIS
jgi:hypothetical protein